MNDQPSDSGYDKQRDLFEGTMYYEQEALRTLSTQFHLENITPNLLHAAMGLSTESAELLDNLKKSLFYGKKLDKPNLIEEAGDLFWYLAVLVDEIATITETSINFEDIMRINLHKLQTRYPDKFSSDKAINRDLSAERKTYDPLA